MATTSEIPRVAILADKEVTGPSAKFDVTVTNNRTKVSGPSELDGGTHNGATSADVVDGVVWLERHTNDFELKLGCPVTGWTVTCVARDATITPTWSGQVATLKLESGHMEKDFAVTCNPPASDGAVPEGVSFTVRVRRGTTPTL